MPNKYLEKIASMPEFFDRLSGKSFRENETMIRSLQRAAAEGKDYAHYAGQREGLRNHMWKARGVTGAAALGTMGLAGYGIHKYNDYQRKKILESYSHILSKEAGFIGSAYRGAKSLAGFGYRGAAKVGRVAKRGFDAGTGLLREARGSGFRQYANDLGLPTENNPFHHQFESAKNRGEQAEALKGYLNSTYHNHPLGSKERSEIVQKIKGMDGDFKHLQTQQSDARMAVAGLAAAPAALYLKGRSDGRKQEQAYSAYY